MIRAMIVLLFLATAAHSKDINLPLTDQEQTALLRVLDIATKAGGLEVAETTIHFAKKIQTYKLQADKPPPPSNQ